MIKQSIAELLETEMDRKDFLKTLAVAAVALTGVTTIVKTLSNQALSRSATTQQTGSPLGYGVSRYSTQPVAVSQPSSSYSA